MVAGSSLSYTVGLVSNTDHDRKTQFWGVAALTLLQNSIAPSTTENINPI